MLGMTEAALRAHVYRESRAIPKPFKMGKRLAWRRATVLRWLEEREKRGT
jgi:predicted DNA-binding transcriptional regulator AlpA